MQAACNTFSNLRVAGYCFFFFNFPPFILTITLYYIMLFDSNLDSLVTSTHLLSSIDARVISTKHQRGSPVDGHVKAVPPTHDTSQVGWAPYEPADESCMWNAIRVLPKYIKSQILELNSKWEHHGVSSQPFFSSSVIDSRAYLGRSKVNERLVTAHRGHAA